MAASAMPTSSRRPTARRAHANPGLPGEERTIWLRLKLIADAGLVGLPNAGKSTFLAAVSSARAEDRRLSLHHAAPQSRRGRGPATREFVIADIPGLIEGAHEGAGLGDRFLGHVERCRVLLHLVDGTGEDPGRGLQDSPRRTRRLWPRPRREAGDRGAVEGRRARPTKARAKAAKALAKAAGRKPLILSAVSGEGVEQALQMLAREIAAATKADPNEVPAAEEERWGP